MTTPLDPRSAPARGLLLLASVGLLACDVAPDDPVEVDAATSVRSSPILFPDPREARDMAGEYDFAVVFVRLAGIEPPGLTPSDLAITLGSTGIGGVINPGDPPPDPGFVTVAEYYDEISHGDFLLSHSVISGVVQVANPPSHYCPMLTPSGWGTGECDASLEADDFLDAAVAQLDFDPHEYDGVIFVVAGQAAPGYGLRRSYEGDVLPIALIHGSYNVAFGAPLGEDQLGTYSTLKSLLIHEIGHAVGDLWHAGALECPDLAIIAEDVYNDCTPSATLNPLSPMSSGAVRHLGAYEKRLVGFIDPEQTWFPPIGHFHETTLKAIELDDPTAYQEIRIPVAEDEFYSIEYRRPIGVDAPPLSEAEASYFVGVTPGEPLHGLIVNLRLAGPTADNDLEIVQLRQLVRPGETFHDNYRGIHVTFTSPLKGDRARVNIATNVIQL
ncbi:MAG: hypothetical protein R3B09_20455 [Nannocystaceae bacterium]